MLEGLYTAAAGMDAQQDKMAAVSNDLANTETTGYKSTRTAFRDLMYDDAGRSSARGVRTGHGVSAVDAGRSLTQGPVERTDDPLDVAIHGQGFLRVRAADGTDALTRDGSLQLNESRVLTTAQGGTVQPRITIPQDVDLADVKISSDGTVSGGGRTFGQLALVTVRSPQNLRAVGDNLFTPSAASGATTRAPASTTLEQGALEGSNVDSSTAMTDLIEAQRSYQLASKAITMADQMMEIANGVKR